MLCPVVLFLLVSGTLMANLSSKIVDQLLFSSEPWRSFPVALQDLNATWEDPSLKMMKGDLRCTKGSGSTLENLDRFGEAIQFHTDGKSVINATLVIEHFNFVYDFCSIHVAKDLFGPLRGHLGMNLVKLSFHVEDTLSGCRAIIDSIALDSSEELIDQPKEFVAYLEATEPQIKSKLKRSLARGVESSLTKAFKRLEDHRFFVPTHCGSI